MGGSWDLGMGVFGIKKHVCKDQRESRAHQIRPFWFLVTRLFKIYNITKEKAKKKKREKN